MNDRYLFKAKRKNWRELPKEEWWVQGGSLITFMDNGIKSYYMPQFNEKCVCEHDEITDDILSFSDCRFFKIDESTLCQYTGLEDKKGTLIWENDICDYDDRAKFVVKFGTYNEFTDKRHIGFYAKWEDRWDGLYREDLGYLSDEVKVIGSIIDNPELLEVGE